MQDLVVQDSFVN